MSSAAFSPDGKRIVTASATGTARIWDAASGKPVGETAQSHDGRVLIYAAFSPDGQRIVTASRDWTAWIWDAASGKTISAPLSVKPTLSATFAKGGIQEVGGMYRMAGQDESIVCAAFSPDGKRIVTASSDNTARIWDAATGKPIGEPLKGHEDRVQRGVQPRRQAHRHRVS